MPNGTKEENKGTKRKREEHADSNNATVTDSTAVSPQKTYRKTTDGFLEHIIKSQLWHWALAEGLLILLDDTWKRRDVRFTWGDGMALAAEMDLKEEGLLLQLTDVAMTDVATASAST